MKSVRILVWVLFVFCILSFVYSSTISWTVDEEQHHMESMKMKKCKVISMIEKVNEYTNTIKFYHEIFNDPGNIKSGKKIENKMTGMIQKLQTGNNLRFFTDQDGKQEITNPTEIAKYLLGLREGRKRTKRIEFDITNVNIQYPKINDKNASKYTIDCVASVTLKYHLITEGNSSGTMVMDVDHMKVCIPD